MAKAKEIKKKRDMAQELGMSDPVHGAWIHEY